MAAVVLVALGFRQVVHTEITTGYALAVLVAPLWVTAVRRFGGARLFLGLGAATAVWGVLLSLLDLPPHVISSSGRDNSLALWLGTLAGIGVVLWARTMMELSSVALFYGVGMLAGGAAGFTASGGNPWKFVWAVPVAVVALALAARTRRRSAELLVLVLLMGLSAVFDSRSYLVSFALTAVLVVWQLRPTSRNNRRYWAFNAIVILVVAWLLYNLATSLLVSGVLGADAQARSVAQIDQSGSLILGGRPELAATFALLRYHLAGFGPGAVPSAHDVIVAKTGMFNIGYDPNNGYVDQFMFGGHIELHSVFGDLWATYGIAGLVMVAVIAYFTVRGVASGIAHKTGSALLLFACTWTLWNLAFSPFQAAEPTLLLTMGLVLFPVAERSPALGRRLAGRRKVIAPRPGGGVRRTPTTSPSV